MSRYLMISALCVVLGAGCSQNADFEDDKNPPGVRTYGPPD